MWAARVVLEVGRRSDGLLANESGTDEAVFAAQGVEVAHGVGSPILTDLRNSLLRDLVGVGVLASGHLESERLAIHAVPPAPAQDPACILNAQGDSLQHLDIVTASAGSQTGCSQNITPRFPDNACAVDRLRSSPG